CIDERTICIRISTTPLGLNLPVFHRSALCSFCPVHEYTPIPKTSPIPRRRLQGLRRVVVAISSARGLVCARLIVPCSVGQLSAGGRWARSAAGDGGRGQSDCFECRPHQQFRFRGFLERRVGALRRQRLFGGERVLPSPGGGFRFGGLCRQLFDFG